jgi:hypothetical protein
VPLYGCDCYAYALLASGFVDLVVEAGLKVYFTSVFPFFFHHIRCTSHADNLVYMYISPLTHEAIRHPCIGTSDRRCWWYDNGLERK